MAAGGFLNGILEAWPSDRLSPNARRSLRPRVRDRFGGRLYRCIWLYGTMDRIHAELAIPHAAESA